MGRSRMTASTALVLIAGSVAVMFALAALVTAVIIIAGE